MSADILAIGIEQQRIFELFLWKQILAQARHEHRVKKLPGTLLDGGHENLAVTPFCRLGPQEGQTAGEHLSHFFECRGPNLRHGTQLRQY